MEDLFAEEKLICSHLGDEYGRFQGAVVPPIFENSLFVFKTLEDLNEAVTKERENYVYTRGTNPTVEILEKKLAALEHGEACKCFSSGMAAVTASINTFIKQGDHILFVNNVYGPALKYAQYLKKFGVEYTLITSCDLKTVEESIKSNTKIIYVESPGTMTFKLLDLKAVADLAKSKGIHTIIDNTWATPLYQKPLDFGIDISLHSCTKYIGGHSDVVAGAAITSKAIMDKMFNNEFMLFGGCIGPFEGWLLMRGMRTLPVRMEKHQESAMKMARFLNNHRNVLKVNYPGLESHPDYELAKKQLKGFSGLMSFELKSDRYEDVLKVVNSCKVFKIGVSWGGFESLIISPNHGNNIDELKALGFYPGLIRLSIGMESIDSLIEDIDNALNKLG